MSTITTTTMTREDDDFQSEDSGSDVEEEYNSDLNEPLAAHEEEDGVFERGIEIE